MSSNNMKRREFLRSAGVASSALIPLTLLQSQPALAQDFPLLEESEPSAAALGYKHDASQVDAAKFPQYKAESLCSNCSLYTGEAGAEAGPCAIFPAKTVAAAGWCSVWTPAPA